MKRTTGQRSGGGGESGSGGSGGAGGCGVGGGAKKHKGGVEEQKISLLEASKRGLLDVVRRRLEEGDDPNQADEYDQTPLLLASENGHVEVVRELLEKGADLNHVVKSDLFDPNQRPDDIFASTPLSEACYNGHEGVVRELLLRGADPDELDNISGYPLIHFGSWAGKVDVLRELLAAGADPTMGTDSSGPTLSGPTLSSPFFPDPCGTTPLQEAEQNGHDECAFLLRITLGLEPWSLFLHALCIPTRTSKPRS